MIFFRKKLFLVIILLLFFSLRAYSYYSYLNDNSSSEMLLELVTGHSGYNAIMIHGSIYAMIFFLGYSFISTPIKIQELVRKGRQEAFKIYEKQMCFYILSFVGAFTIVYVVYANYKYDMLFLAENNFYIGCMLEFLVTLLVYAFIGELYLMLFFFMLSKAKAFALASIVSIILAGLTVIYHIWLPFASIDVFDKIYEEGLSLLNFFFECIVIAIMVYSLRTITILRFNKRDIL